MNERILIVAHGHPEISPGGAELAAYQLFKALRDQPGLDVVFLAWAGNARRAHGGTPFSSFRGRPDELLFASEAFDHFLFSQPTDVIDQFAALLRQIAPDVVHMHHYSRIGLEFIALARRIRPSARIVVTLHEYLAICNNYGQMIKTDGNVLCHEEHPDDCAVCFRNIPATEFLLRKLFVRAHFEKVDMFIAPSEFLRQRYIAWGLPAWQIIQIDNGIPPAPRLAPRPLTTLEERSVFAFFGQINPFKGLTTLLTAFSHLAHAVGGRDIRLIIHGANLEHCAPEFIESITRLLSGNAGRVHFAGPYERRSLAGLMAAVDWVVVPSIWWENSPLVIEESLAFGRPVLCSDIGGMAEKVRPGLDGFHFQAGNPFDLAATMRRLASEPSLWDRLQTSMRRPMWIDESAARTLELYRDRAFAVAS